MSAYPDKLPIVPFTRPVRGSVTLPGSKSITNRALILAALTKGRAINLCGALFSRDTEIMVTALRQLGFQVDTDEAAARITITGHGGEIPVREARIHVGNAGTAARFLTAFVCLRPDGVYHFDGDDAMRRRPIGALLEALESQGAKADSRSFPFTLRTSGLSGGTVELDASESSQMLSALLMVAPHARSPLTVKLKGGAVARPFVAMTEHLVETFAHPQWSAGYPGHKLAHIDYGQGYNFESFARSDYFIEPDASAASYFLALPCVTGGELFIGNLPEVGAGLQGDAEFINVLARLGAETNTYDGDMVVKMPAHGKRRGLTENFREFSDTFLTLAAIAPLLDGPTKISGIAHTRKQETDRVAGMATELGKIIGKANITEETDSLEIRPIALDEIRKRVLENGPIEIETYHDHRFAMSFAILGCYNLFGKGEPRPWLTIKDPGCCAKTFPNFFDELEQLRADSLAQP